MTSTWTTAAWRGEVLDRVDADPAQEARRPRLRSPWPVAGRSVRARDTKG